MDDENLFYRMGLASLRNLTLEEARNLLSNFEMNPKFLFQSRKSDLTDIGIFNNDLIAQILDDKWKKRAENELVFVNRNCIETYFFLDTNYPTQFVENSYAPLLFYSNRPIDFNAKTFVSIVGTRKMSENGRRSCLDLVKDLARYKEEFVIVSGLAYGVDITAHRAALEFGVPTIAVLAHGLDRIYPSAHSSVARSISKNGGGLITDYMSVTNPDRHNFLDRNRIIAGISEFIIIIETKDKGGSLCTAERANEMGKKIYAFPGRIYDDGYKGCNNLIKNEIAFMLTSSEEFLNDLEKTDLRFKGKRFRAGKQVDLFSELTEEELQIVKITREYPDGIQINELVLKSKLPVYKLNSLLLYLEFQGLIRPLPGGVYRLQKK